MRHLAKVEGEGVVVVFYVAVVEFQEGFAVVGGAGHVEEEAQVVEGGVVAGVVVWVGQEPLAGFGGFVGFDGLGHDRGGLVVCTRRVNAGA